jgi:hypothetical protein
VLGVALRAAREKGKARATAKDVGGGTRPAAKKKSEPVPAPAIDWIEVDDMLPEMGEIVLIHRVGGEEELNLVGIGFLQKDCSWLTTGDGKNYWGTAIDGSEVAAWAQMPAAPGMERAVGL